MAVSQLDIDNLNAAIAAGARSVTLRGKTIIYNTTDSLIAARNDMQDQFAKQSATPRRSRRIQVYFAGRGYE
jgi:hypothetical protein